MNGYSADILRARTRQRRFYLIVAASVSSIFLLLFIVFGLMKVISVEVLPGDALETAVIDIKKGAGFSTGMKVYTFSSASLLKIGATGFATETVEIPAGHGGRLRVELTELPGKLRVETSAADDASRWLLDGRLVAVSRSLKIELNPGNYSLEVDSLYHEKKVIDVRLARGEEKILFINLTPVHGEMNISSVPGGVPVKINGKIEGETPIAGSYTGGSYSLEIITSDYETVSEQIEITNVSPGASRNYRLRPKQSYLNFDLVPAGGDLILNGRKINQTSQVAINAAMPNTVTYLKNGYSSESRSATLASGETRTISFHLRAEMGKVEINSKPVAEVSINGKPQGKTPLTVSLLAVKQRITLSKKGYRSVTKVLTPSRKKTAKFSATLQEEGLARLAEAKARYKNPIGMEFKLFTPSQLNMGAARHEKGQRANEFERNVDLKKPFYMGLKEVTISQYSRFRKWAGPASSGNYPVTSISWLDAAAFCNWLSAQEKLSAFYVIRNGKLSGINKTSDGYRLPAEAEWEWLARKAGRKNQTRFTWGNKVVVPAGSGNIADESARNSVNVFVPNYNDGYEKLAPVASFNPELSGLYDLTGNVSEWVHDYYSLVPPRNKTQETDPLGDTTGNNHVIKGSSWRSGTLTELRASYRDSAADGREDTGFRVARYLYAAEEYGD